MCIFTSSGLKKVKIWIETYQKVALYEKIYYFKELEVKNNQNWLTKEKKSE